jgi:transcriptional repressor NrdR
MVCIYCSSSTHVTNSRFQKRLNQVWRRRRCIACSNTFTTQEAVDYSKGFVFKTTAGKLVPLERDKLFLSIYISCSHRRSAQTDASALVDTVLATLRSVQKTSIISHEQVIIATYEILKRFDGAAAVHYQAHHPLQTKR